jgi:hypothetical protein
MTKAQAQEFIFQNQFIFFNSKFKDIKVNILEIDTNEEGESTIIITYTVNNLVSSFTLTLEEFLSKNFTLQNNKTFQI